MALNFFQVDAFASEAFKGNPAAVVFVHGQKLSSRQMQVIAMENNLSETAYLEHADPNTVADAAYFASSSSFRLRWFTPASEAPLCGHATLVSAAAIFQGTSNPHEKLEFQTLSGVLVVTRPSAAALGPLQMDLPSYAGRAEDVPPEWTSPDGELMQALFGTSRSKADSIVYQAEPLGYLLISLAIAPNDAEAAIRAVSPDFDRLKKVTSHGLQSVIVTCCTSDQKILSRFFAPVVGINEDPVTGSAHSVLVPFWRKHHGRDRFQAEQCSLRGGHMQAEYISRPAATDVVRLTADACVVIAGKLFLTGMSAGNRS